ncbi:bifunctional [glutamine synthetase] adenylyltransferase/[glutamine synthetase]-adenylyl-L-tyrosine phosphorylase [Aeromicrobium duanguangcaii]|uniref:Bifunctional glutamine synthetase adenylyltransferase/adenylyl-removing enzyme n=1 Tax=Aeromicrobium duanguangcaii TaxID=2968086 RepID=A0ABY5KGS8_9ACTN|nr:bifunctional [glutamine synthetase] adenylyltransferase/[glutamine synthetase]-adenylyl-L-tyrosine phosphorylase [Aeromicrobium duanguangcaii]MCD9153362.1 bifunctional [glutamine synthetase] adenylyltransferase/[glutamine synthetase]-adenylyl-L-tyrosine phosphorylase [Aeromicrobium duanguangcaii]UUI69545.1 bifunctional [glutamine synthetase] adenylyltransferase/[glutamine synthetase]-adenylyl-L-tyrosine phosphorylase [Aeromicrobium duanguangcaii]
MSRSRFADPETASANLARLGAVSAEFVEQISAVADPDTALTSLVALAETDDGRSVIEALDGDPVLRQRAMVVLGTSRAIGDFWRRHPQYVMDLVGENLLERPATEPEYRDWLTDATDPDALRVRYHRELAAIAARDLNAHTTFAQSSAELSDLAVATLEAALRIAVANEPEADLVRLAVIALGKTGGHELNYVSDVDVIFVHEPAEGADDHRASAVAARLASAIIRICGEHTAEGTIWEVDPNLRPEGKQGPLSRTLASHIAYYDRWAVTWEFQALLKTRYAAGDRELADQYLAALQPLVWKAAERADFVPEVRRMRRRVIENIPAAHRDRQLKLGSGGLRDVEFAVQLLQLVHGRVDEQIRSPNTLEALSALTERGYVGWRDGSALEESYEFLRALEHRLQLFRLRRTHLVPEDPDDLRRIGRSMGFATNPADNLVKEWQAHRRIVSRLHEKIFYRPLLEAVASLPEDRLRLSTQAAEDRLAALGFSDPRGAMAHISALSSGVTRRAVIQRSLLPAMLSWFAESPQPDAALLAFRQISEELGDSPWYLRKLRDEGTGAQQFAQMLSSSTYVTDLIRRAPDAVALLGDDEALVPRELERLDTEMTLAARRHPIPDGAVRAIRRIRRRELCRVAMSDVLGRLDITEVGEALTSINTATIAATLRTAELAWSIDHDRPVPTRNAIILMGRLGGHEAGYGSDADVMFVHDPIAGADVDEAKACALWVAQLIRKMLGAAGADPALEIDAGLRPEGKNGPLVRTFDAYAAYYAKWSDTWEAQALLRAEAAIGDPELCERFTALIDPLRYPEDGLSTTQEREIRRIKARVDSERLPRGANPNTHLKLGRGGLADVEWTIQLLQMQHAHRVPELRTTRTLAALEAAAEAGLLSTEDAQALIESWRLVARIRNGVVLWRAKPAESMVETAMDRAGLAHLLGIGQDHTEEMVNDYMRITRRARQVVERVFYE